MRRPLLVICLCIAALSAIRLYTGPPPRASDAFLAVTSSAGGTSSVESPAISGQAPEDGDTVTVTGRVTRIQARESYGQKNYIIYINSVILEEAAVQGADIPLSMDLICEVSQEVRPKIGSQVRIRGQFKYFTNATNKGQFDQAQYYRIQGIGGRVRKAKLLGCGQSYSFLGEGLYRLKERWRLRIYENLPEKEASVLCTMLLGEKEGLDSEVKELYKRNGIVHILSISGLHITLIGMGIYRLLRRLGCPKLAAALAGGLLLVLYGFLTGMGVSACRAIGMYLIRMLGECLGRTYDMLTAMGIVGAAMLAVQPEYLRHSGFLLSYGSICGIGLLLPALEKLWLEQKQNVEQKRMLQREKELKKKLSVLQKQSTDREHGLLSKLSSFKIFPAIQALCGGLRQAFLAGLSITLFTLPVHLYFYYEIPVYSIFLNMLVLPLMSVVMILGLAVMLIPGAGSASVFLRMILAGYEAACMASERLPFHTWTPGCPALWQIVIYYVLLLVAVGFVCGAGSQRFFRLRTGAQNLADKDEDRAAGKAGGKQSEKAGSKQPEKANGKQSEKAGSKQPEKANGKQSEKAGSKQSEKANGKQSEKAGSKQSEKADSKQSEKAGGKQSEKAGSKQSEKAASKLSDKAVVVVLLTLAVFLLGLRLRGGFEVTFLDVGQGDCIYVRTDAGENYLFDCGSSDKSQVGNTILIPFLKYHGVRRLDAVFLSHPDLDHCSGLLELLEDGEEAGISIEKLVLPDIAEGGKADILTLLSKSSTSGLPKTSYIARGVSWQSGNTGFTCLHPYSGMGTEDANSYSECFLVRYGDFSLLLTGDVEGEGEKALLEELTRLNMEKLSVLKVAHHGSRNSTPGELLRLLRPGLAVISCGRDNSYGHPHAELLKRLEEEGCVILKTPQTGAVTVRVNRRKVKIYYG